MQTFDAPGKTWVRAALFVPTFLIVFFGLGFLSGYLFESGRRGLGDTLGYLDWATLLIAMLVGPAWVIGDLPSLSTLRRALSGRRLVSRTTP